MEEIFSLTEKGTALLAEVASQEERLGRSLTDEEAELLLDRYSRTLCLLEGILL
jgi:DNA-binding MarR family transcriptional regulator